jgi:hypothetical protein
VAAEHAELIATMQEQCRTEGLASTSRSVLMADGSRAQLVVTESNWDVYPD